MLTVKSSLVFYKLSNTAKSIGPLKSNDTIISKDVEMVELLSSQFESVFTDEDQCGVALLQPPLLTRATVGELVNISRDLVQTYIRRIKTNNFV